MATARLNGTTIAFEDGGGDKPAVILSHGFLMDGSMFADQVAALRDMYRVITWDERGFGGTPSIGPFDYWDSARDAWALLDHLGVDTVVAGGMSQGGFISLRMALLNPQRVSALVLIDTQAGTEDPALAGPYEELHSAWLTAGPQAVQEVVASIILGEGDWQHWYAKWANLEELQFTTAFRCLMDRDDVTSRLGEILAPTLIIHGTADIAIPMHKAEQLRDEIAGPTTLVVVDGGTHASNITHPQEVNQAMRSFLDSLSL